jgi:hypothetical protein
MPGIARLRWVSVDPTLHRRASSRALAGTREIEHVFAVLRMEPAQPLVSLAGQPHGREGWRAPEVNRARWGLEGRSVRHWKAAP